MKKSKERKASREKKDLSLVHWSTEAQDWMTEISHSITGGEMSLLPDWKPDWSLESLDLRY